jgi:uncharacterized membrane protein (DUF373 family)
MVCGERHPVGIDIVFISMLLYIINSPHVSFYRHRAVRDPLQVFVLLETLYGAYDYMAKCRNIFKVETVGDCYIAGT